MRRSTNDDSFAQILKLRFKQHPVNESILISIHRTNNETSIRQVRSSKCTQALPCLVQAITAILISLVGKVGAAIQTIPTAVLGGIMLLLFGSIASVGINNLVKAKIDMNKTRNLIIASLILTIGIGGAIISFGKFSLAGIGLASIVGVILNLIIPDKEAAEAEAKTE